MGNCCEETKKDFDIVNPDEGEKKRNKHENKIVKGPEINNNNFILIDEKIDKIPITKNKLKLIVQESKSLNEGKEYIINSQGLLDSLYHDGVVIFGGKNVSFTNLIYETKE